MPQSPTSRPDVPKAAHPDNSSPVATDRGTDQGLEFSLAKLAMTLSAHSERDMAADLALDLVLNNIVEQAKLATNANAAAIALATGHEMVCRATTGANAPDLGVRLDSQYGLSGACVRTGVWQRCDDTETDTRVNAEACRYLGVRSILVYPLLKGEEMLGVMEVFSSRPTAFSDREIRTLEALARNVVENIDRAAGVFSPSAEDDVILSDLPESRLLAALAVPPRDSASSPSVDIPEYLAEIAKPVDGGDVRLPDRASIRAEVFPAVLAAEPRADWWTTVLTIVVIALAVTLGWLVGHVGEMRSRAAHSAKVEPVHSSQGQAQPPATVVAKETAAGPPADKASVTAPGTVDPKASKPDAQPGNGLVVYDKGKVVFRMNPAQGGASDPDGISAAALRTEDKEASAKPANLTPVVASRYLIGRVEPDYPPQAREQHLQGAVVLQVLVGDGGSVENVTSLSGDPILVSAASDAVRQWQFRPYLQNGHAQAFQTQVTVSFRMP